MICRAFVIPVSEEDITTENHSDFLEVLRLLAYFAVSDDFDRSLDDIFYQRVDGLEFL